jgi:ATP-dependent DNA helicase RecG
MLGMNIKDLIGEATEYDKKLALEEKKPKSWCKSVSAFANTFGGALIFGISNEGMVVGLENPEGDAEKISEVIKTRLDPMPEFKLRFYQTEDGKVLIILDVYKGDETPYYYSGDGVLEAYVRVGNESVKATATELKRLVLRGKNTSYDSQNSTYKAEDYAFSKLKERYKKWTGNSFDDKDLISFGLVNEQGNLTNAGALLADESPIRCSRLFCTRWNGLNKSGGAVDALDDAEYSGSVISLIENGEAFIKRNCKMKWRKTANSREEMPEYVERSYHEALVNALAHRDYLVNGSEVHIDIYDDRMEIYSPGGMPDGSMIQDRDPLMVPSTRRNPVLADVFNRLGYMERKGSGFGKIISGYEFQINYDESKRPSFRSDRYQFTVVMPNLNYDVSHDFEENETMSESMSESMSELMSKLERTRMQIILHYLDTNKEINSSIAAKLLKVEIKTASRLLLKAEKLDILNSYGKTKNKVYFRE